MFEKSSKKAFTSKRYDALEYCVEQEINVILGMLLHQEIPIFILKQNGSRDEDGWSKISIFCF